MYNRAFRQAGQPANLHSDGIGVSQVFSWQALQRMVGLRGRVLRILAYQTQALSPSIARDGLNLIPQTRPATNGTEGNATAIVVLPTNAWRAAQQVNKAGYALSCTPRRANSSQPLERKRVTGTLGKLAWSFAFSVPIDWAAVASHALIVCRLELRQKQPQHCSQNLMSITGV